MTAMTASTEWSISKGIPEKEVRVVRLTGSPAFTYTPTVSQGGTVYVINCLDASTAYDQVPATVSGNVVTIDASGTTTTAYVLTYYIE